MYDFHARAVSAIQPTSHAKSVLVEVRCFPEGHGPYALARSSSLICRDGQYFLEISDDRNEGTNYWQQAVPAEEAKHWLNEISRLCIPLRLEGAPRADGYQCVVTIHGESSQLSVGWWEIAPRGCEVLQDLADWVLHWSAASALPTDDERADEFRQKLNDLMELFREVLLHVDRKAVEETVIKDILKHYAALPSPDMSEGLETGLDFLGLLKTEGSNHGLCELGFDTLRDDIYRSVGKLDYHEKFALIFPFAECTEVLIDEQEVDEFIDNIYREDAWLNHMQKLVLRRIPDKHMHDEW
jgi:hypothetical protein